MTSSSSEKSANTSNKTLSQIIAKTRSRTNPPATAGFDDEKKSLSTMAAITNPFNLKTLDNDEVEEHKKQKAALLAKIAKLEDENLEKEDLLYQTKEDYNVLNEDIKKLRATNRLLRSTNSTLIRTVQTYSHQIENLQDDFERSLLDQEANNITNQDFLDLWEERDRMVYSKKCAFQRIETMMKDFEKTKADFEAQLAQEAELVKSLTNENLCHRNNDQKLSTTINKLRMELDNKQHIIEDQQEQIIDQDDMINGFEDIISCLSPATHEAIKTDCTAKKQELETFALQTYSEPVVENMTATSATLFSQELCFGNTTPSSSTKKKTRGLLTKSDQNSWDDCL